MCNFSHSEVFIQPTAATSSKGSRKSTVPLFQLWPHQNDLWLKTKERKKEKKKSCCVHVSWHQLTCLHSITRLNSFFLFCNLHAGFGRFLLHNSWELTCELCRKEGRKRRRSKERTPTESSDFSQDFALMNQWGLHLQRLRRRTLKRHEVFECVLLLLWVSLNWRLITTNFLIACFCKCGRTLPIKQ